MAIERLDHVNIRTHDLEGTRAFWVEVIGLRVDDRPPFAFPGYWLYDTDVAVIHLTVSEPGDPPGAGSGSIDHIAFRAAGLAELRARLATRQVAFDERLVPRNGDLQIFLHDPNGIAIELTFAAAEVERHAALA